MDRRGQGEERSAPWFHNYRLNPGVGEETTLAETELALTKLPDVRFYRFYCDIHGHSLPLMRLRDQASFPRKYGNEFLAGSHTLVRAQSSFMMWRIV
jgi:hypothetical protein